MTAFSSILKLTDKECAVGLNRKFNSSSPINAKIMPLMPMTYIPAPIVSPIPDAQIPAAVGARDMPLQNNRAGSKNPTPLTTCAATRLGSKTWLLDNKSKAVFGNDHHQGAADGH